MANQWQSPSCKMLDLLDLPGIVHSSVIQKSGCWSQTRLLCRYLQREGDAGLTSLHLRWSTPAAMADMPDLGAFLAKLPQLTNLDGSCTELVEQGQDVYASCQNLQLPLIALPRLRILNLDGSSMLDDLIPLAACTNLRRLNLNGCSRVSSLLPLAALTQLVDMQFTKCALVDNISVLSGYTALEQLMFGENSGNLTNLSPLTALTNLVGLHILTNASTDLKPLASCTSLNMLTLAMTAITDLHPLVTLPRLKHLNLIGCQSLTTLAPLQRASALIHLLVVASPISDSLPAIKSLETMWAIQVTGIVDLTALVQCARLQELHLYHTLHSGLAALQTALPKMVFRTDAESDAVPDFPDTEPEW